jgi:ribosomal protein S18 acetylase RimI-like enzyme
MSIEDVNGVNVLFCKLGTDQMSKNSFCVAPVLDFDLRSFYKKCLKNKNCAIFVAKLGNEVVGYIELWQRDCDENFEVAPFIYAQHLFVDEAARGNENSYKILIGLYEKAESWAKEKSYEFLGVDVYGFNTKVQSLVNSLGFTSYKTRFVKKLAAQ